MRKEALELFMNMPLTDGTQVLETFAGLPGAVYCRGTNPLERFVFVPGHRKDRVVLVAHCDTVWDTHYPRRPEQVGIGADDRAGCALLWLLRDSGHSLLVLDGEEHGKRGASFLRRHHKKLLGLLNRHSYMLELDWRGSDCLFKHIPHTDAFRAYILQQLDCRESDGTGGCDLSVLCRSSCGVNMGIGYRGQHTNLEELDAQLWNDAFTRLTALLAQPQPHFPLPLTMRLQLLLRPWKLRFQNLLRKLRGK